MRLYKIIIGVILISSFIKAQTSVSYQWAKGIGGISFDKGYSTIVDASGNVYFTGYFSSSADFDPGVGVVLLNSGGGTDMFLAKYDALGNYLWAKSIGGGADDKSYSIANDALGNLYITGKFSYSVDFDPGPGTAILNSPGGSGMFFAKYDANGNYIWAKSVGTNNDIEGIKIALDPLNNCIITGYKWAGMDFDPGPGVVMLNQLGQLDLYFAKYDSNGNYLFAKNIGGTGTDFVSGKVVTCDASGNIYIGGFFNSTIDFDPGIGTSNLTTVNGADIVFAKYDSNGNYIWAKSIGSTNDDYLQGIAVDNGGNVIITGAYRGPADFDPSASSAILNPLGPGGMDDIFLAKYSSNGNLIWANSMGGVSQDGANTIKLDALGQIYIAGVINGVADVDPGIGSALLYSNGGADIFFAKYDNIGNHIWSKSLGSASYDYCIGMDVDVNGVVYITGSFAGPADFDPDAPVANINWYASDDIFIAKYIPTPLSIKTVEGINVLSDVSPNPNNGEFRIYSETESEFVIFNALGQAVFEKKLSVGNNFISANGLQAGLYNYLVTNGISNTKAGKLAIQ